LIDAKKIATNEQLNAIILRDTADKVKVAERIIRANDKARAEVVVDIELLQLNSSKLLDLGVTWPSSLSTQINTGSEDNTVRLSDLGDLNQSNWTITVPSFAYDFVKTSTDAQLLAKPQLRISEGERATLTIGDRVPVPVTSFNTGNTIGGNIVPITSFQYQDVGIKISIEPRVHHNKEVTLTIQVEVSNLSGEVVSGGQSQPIIGTRNIESTIRLKDGETNFLAGLLRTDETRSESGLPGLSELPIIGRLFGSNRNSNQRTDVILTLTPRIIRSADITEEDLLPIWVGTESNITFRGGSPRVESEVDGPFDGESDTSADEIRELIQRRIQRLPRGLRGQAGEVPGVDDDGTQEPGGIELVPGSPPRNLFDRQQEEEPPSGFRTPDVQLPEDDEPPQRNVGGRGGSGGSFPSSPFGSGSASSSLRLDPNPEDGVLAFLHRPDAGRPGVGKVALAATTPAAVAEAAVRLSLTPRGLWAQPGDTFEITVAVEALTEVSHLPLTLTFDPAVLEIAGVRPGDFLGGDGEAQVLTDVSHPGELVLGASRLGTVSGVKGKGALAHVTFRALAAGTAEIGFTKAQAMDAQLQKIEALAVEPVSIEIRQPHLPEDRPKPPKPAIQNT
jgi:hypothetical protein